MNLLAVENNFALKPDSILEKIIALVVDDDDIRRGPSAGNYPMRYAVAIEGPPYDKVGDNVLTDKWDIRETVNSQVSYANYFHSGGNARIRVRGVNAKGAGPRIANPNSTPCPLSSNLKTAGIHKSAFARVFSVRPCSSVTS